MYSARAQVFLEALLIESILHIWPSVGYQVVYLESGLPQPSDGFAKAAPHFCFCCNTKRRGARYYNYFDAHDNYNRRP